MLNKIKHRREESVDTFSSHQYIGIRYIIFLVLLFLVLILSILFSSSIGIAGGNIKILIQTIIFQEEMSEIGEIMLKMRVPRALAACFTGAAFSFSGAIMQGVTRNPLADAGLLGINAGAGFLVALSSVLLPSLSSFGTMGAAFLGASIAMLMVYMIGIRKHNSSAISLILAGTSVSALLIALSQFISITFGLSKNLSYWIAGSLSGITWNRISLTIPWIISAILIGMFFSRQLSILSLGDESATGLGINVKLTRTICMVIVLFLAGASVSLVGGISFIGLIIPHSARLLVGSNYSKILPTSALLGAILLVISDIVARMIYAPYDTPVGALISIIGVPIFLALTYRKKGM